MALDGSNSKPKYFPAFCKISLLRLLWNSIQPSTAFSGMLLRSEEHTSELQSQSNLVCRLLLEKKNPATNVRALLRLRVPNLLSQLSPAPRPQSTLDRNRTRLTSSP